VAVECIRDTTDRIDFLDPIFKSASELASWDRSMVFAVANLLHRVTSKLGSKRVGEKFPCYSRGILKVVGRGISLYNFPGVVETKR
jgi:hypothetical protein